MQILAVHVLAEQSVAVFVREPARGGIGERPYLASGVRPTQPLDSFEISARLEESLLPGLPQLPLQLPQADSVTSGLFVQGQRTVVSINFHRSRFSYGEKHLSC